MLNDSHTLQVLQSNRWRIAGALALLLFATAPTIQTTLMESRTYRDFTGLTAFRGVVLERAQVDADDMTIHLQGSFVKRRCHFLELVAYVTKDGLSTVARVTPEDTDPAKGVINRPPMDTPQQWGPWAVTSKIPSPDTVEVYTRHTCPDEARPQTNLFVEAAWAPYP